MTPERFLILIIKVIVFYICVFSLFTTVGQVFNTDIIKCNYLTNTNTNLFSLNKTTDPIWSVFYGCDNNEIKHYYIPEHIFNKFEYNKDFVIYRNYFGSTRHYYISLLESIIIYLGIGPFFCSAINWLCKQIINY